VNDGDELLNMPLMRASGAARWVVIPDAIADPCISMQAIRPPILANGQLLQARIRNAEEIPDYAWLHSTHTRTRSSSNVGILCNVKL